MTETEQTALPKKPWFKKMWIWVVVGAVLLIGVVGNIAGVGDEAPTASPSPTAQMLEVPDVAGQEGDSARLALTDLGLLVEFDAGEETVIVASNWTVDSQMPAAGSAIAVGDTVVLTVSKPEAVEEPQSNELDEVTAAQFLALSWEQRFIYGGNVHWIADRISTANDDGTWTFKIGVKLENAYGNEYGGTIEGDVGGTRDAPTIIDSILYTDTGEVIDYNE